jgi:hypothetical protein
VCVVLRRICRPLPYHTYAIFPISFKKLFCSNWRPSEDLASSRCTYRTSVACTVIIMGKQIYES